MTQEPSDWYQRWLDHDAEDFVAQDPEPPGLPHAEEPVRPEPAVLMLSWACGVPMDAIDMDRERAVQALRATPPVRDEEGRDEG